MTNQPKQIFFLVSTAGHVRGFSELARLVSNSGIAKTSILNFPSDSMAKSSREPDSEIQELVWRGDTFSNRNDLIRSSCSAFSLKHRFYNMVDNHLRNFLVFFLATANSMMFFGTLTYFAVTNSLLWFFGSKPRPVPSLGEEFLSKVFADSFSFIWKAKRYLPSNKIPIIGGPLNFIAQALFYGLWSRRSTLEGVSGFFRKSRPDLLVLPEQNFGYWHEILFFWARENNVPVLVIPYSLAGHQEWAENFKEMPECHVKGIFRRLIARAFPKWVLKYKGDRLILPLSYIFSCEHLKCVPTIPWVTNSGPEGFFAVDNAFLKDFYSREGVDTSKWRVIGSLAEDCLFRNLEKKAEVNERIARNLGLNSSLPVVLIGLPPEQFSLGIREGMEFDNYRSLVDFIIDTVKACCGGRYNILVNLHPRTSKKDVAYIESDMVRIIDGPIEEILPVAVLYVSVISATIRWAIACGVPVLNFDAYQAHYADYNGLAGVVEVNTKKQFELELSSIVNGPTYLEQLTANQKIDAQRMFRLDGHAKDRIVELMEQLSAKSLNDTERKNP